MSRHQDSNERRGKKISGRSGSYKAKTTAARGNAPIKKTAASKKETSLEAGIRLNKYVANSGICSRRQADENIAIGLVSVNGKVVTQMGYKVQPGDEVKYDGSIVIPEKPVYVLLNKPKGFATTTSNTKDRTVMDLVANSTTSNIKPVGRLGRNSTGLLLFTNDDDISKKFTQSKSGVPRLFHIQLDKNLKFEDFKKVQDGFKIEDKYIAVEEISYIDEAPKNEVGLKIKNTGNSIIRSIFEHLNYDILKIDCVAIAHLTKKDLTRGRWRYLTDLEVSTLKML